MGTPETGPIEPERLAPASVTTVPAAVPAPVCMAALAKLLGTNDKKEDPDPLPAIVEVWYPTVSV